LTTRDTVRSTTPPRRRRRPSSACDASPAARLSRHQVIIRMIATPDHSLDISGAVINLVQILLFETSR
jgi:hypothetical protein